MRTSWAWAAVLALCVCPTLAEARERERDRAVARERHPSPGRQSDRGARQSDRGARQSDRGARQSYRPERQPDRGDRQARESGNRDSGWRSSRGGGPGQVDRPGRVDRSDRSNDSRRSSNQGGYSSRDSRGSDRGRGSRDSWSGYRNDRRDDGRWRGSYRGAPRRAWPTFRSRPRYPAYYRYGYYHRHGYYFPRYYYDYELYPTHASIRMHVEPAEAEVYVDGYYAGVVDDFDGFFQRLNLAPGRHQITLRLDGYRTWGAEVYATPGDTLNLHHDMIPGPSGTDYYDGERGPDEYGAPGAYEEREPERE